MKSLIRHYSDSKTAFLCCDLQERFSTLVPHFPQYVQVAKRFSAATAVVPNTKFIVTEQYPERLGKTVDTIPIPAGSAVYPKKEFSMYGTIAKDLADVDCCVIFGIESHVCVMQTVGDLLDKTDKEVVLALDGIGSTNKHDFKGAKKAYQAMAAASNNRLKISTSESILFQMMRSADDPIFKNVSKIIKEIPVVVSK